MVLTVKCAKKVYNRKKQSSESGSTGYVCFWDSCIHFRIRNLFVRIQILPPINKKWTKTLISTIWDFLQKGISIFFWGQLEGHWRKEQDREPHPDPLVKDKDPKIRIRIRIRNKMSRTVSGTLEETLHDIFCNKKKWPLRHHEQRRKDVSLLPA